MVSYRYSGNRRTLMKRFVIKSAVLAVSVLLIIFAALMQIECRDLVDETIEAGMQDFQAPKFYLFGINISKIVPVKTNLDTHVEGTYEVKYYCFPKSYVKKVTVVDTSAPSLTLVGDKEVTVASFDDYKELGCVAMDSCDGDLSQNVTKTFTKVMEANKIYYDVEYSVKDNHGNKAMTTRRVNIEKEKKGIVYLTFDDGPSVKLTAQVLDILKKYKINASFFLLSFEGNEEKENLVKRMFEEGNTIGLHGVSHEYKTVYQSLGSVIRNFMGIQSQVYNVTGENPIFIRFPGGSSNTVSKKYSKEIMTKATAEMQRRGFVYFDWNVDSDDAGSAKTKEKIYENVTSGIMAGRENIVLMHDSSGHSATIEALEEIIIWCMEEGYELKPLSLESYTAHHGINN